MVQIKRDKYVLGQSSPTTLDAANKKIKMNIQLQLASTGSAVAASVSGKVTDSSSANVSGALVSIMDANYQPLIHTLTDASGNYGFAAVPASSSYNIFAIASGKQLNQGTSFTITAGSTVVRNFTLATETSASLGVIVGDVIKTGTTTPIAGAVATLHSAVAGETLTAIAYTNDFGQYAFRDIPVGNYFIEINGLGYISKRILSVNIATAGQILNQDINLDGDPNASKATISGVITDAEGNPIPRADTVLYSIAADSSLTAVAYNKTNSNGVYLFTNVSQGSYRVKSNFMESVEYTVPVTDAPRPSIDNLSLSMSTTVIPITRNGADFTLAGGANLNTSTGYILALGNTGGAGGGGNATTTVNVPVAGTYIMSLKYVAFQIRTLRVDLNGAFTGTDHQFSPSTDYNNPGTFNITMTLLAGDNTIKLYNADTVMWAPDIKSMTITKTDDVVTRNAIDFSVTNGANYAAPGFVYAIGNTAGGTATATVNVNQPGKYRLDFKYYANTIRPLKLDINGTYTGVDNQVPISSDYNNPGTFSTTVTLVSGSNTIKMYNSSTTTWAPDISRVTATKVPESISKVVGDYALSGPAYVDATLGFVFALGNTGGGTATLTVNAPVAGNYNCVVTYRGNEARPMKVDINGVFSASYTVPADLSNSATYTVPVMLNSGNNTIKFYNSSTTLYAPDLKGAVITQTLYNDLQEAESATLAGSATASNGFVSGLGGSGGGSVTMTKVVPYAGVYDLSLAYVTTTIGTKIKVLVNGVDTGSLISFDTTPTMNAADKKTVTVRVTLNAGSNTIKIM